MLGTASRGKIRALWLIGLGSLLGVVPAQAQGPQQPPTVVFAPQMPQVPPGGYVYPPGQPAPNGPFVPPTQPPQGNFPPPAMNSPGGQPPFLNQYQSLPVQTRTVVVPAGQPVPFPNPMQPGAPAGLMMQPPPGTPLPPPAAVPDQPPPNNGAPPPVVNNLSEMALPVRVAPAGQLPPLPALPPGATMGGYPAAPDGGANPESPVEALKRLMTVELRDGGVLRPYGLFRGDLDFATNHFNDIQYPLFVLPSDPRFKTGPGLVPNGGHDFNYSLYPYLTRLGLEYYGKELDCGLKTSGRLEFDFLSEGQPGFESRDTIRLRLAYVQLQWHEWSLVVGQDWDIIAPLVPTINDNTYLWDAGNLGGFRPQVKLLWDHDLGRGYSVQVQNGIALADVFNRADLGGNGFTDNQDSGVPSYQGRVGLLMPSAVCDQKIMLGGWGFWLLDRTRVPVGVEGRDLFPGWGTGLDLRVPLTERLTFQGEFFHGKNMDDYRGGIGQGINPLTGQTIASTGGWAELVFRPYRWYQGSVGFAIDAPDRSEIPVGGRTRNYVWYIGNRFPVGNGVTLGYDYQHYTTDYNGFHRGEASLIKFFCQLAF